MSGHLEDIVNELDNYLIYTCGFNYCHFSDHEITFSEKINILIDYRIIPKEDFENKYKDSLRRDR